MNNLWQDIRYGVRVLLNKPGFTIVAVLSLALGIGANTAIFSLVRANIYAPLPVEDAGNLVSIFTTDEKNPGNLPTSHFNYQDYRDKTDVFTELTAFSLAQVSLADESEARQIGIEVVTGNYFDALGVKASIGRTFLKEEDQTERTHPVVVLNNNFWQDELGGDPSVIGKTISLNRHSFTIVGVAPKDFNGITLGGTPALWVPMSMHNEVQPQIAPRQPPYNERRGLFLSMFGRLKPGVSIQQAQSVLSALASQLEQEFPNDNQGRNVKLIPLLEARINPTGNGQLWLTSMVLMSVAGIVLLIACANIANLLLARATARRKEIAIRLAVGASRTRLIRQLLTESFVLSLIGGVIGYLVALWSRDILGTLTFSNNANVAISGFDPFVLGFALAVTFLSGLLFGLAPALQASKPDLVPTLKNETSPSRRRTRLSLRQALVVAQVALSLVALVSAGLFIRSLQNALAVNPGFITENVLLLSFNLAREGYSDEQGKQFQREMIERVHALPGVEAASFAQNRLLAPTILRTTFIEGRETEDDGHGISVRVNNVDHDFFTTIGIPILRGRAFDDTDNETAPLRVIINEAMANQFWPGQDALGKRFRFSREQQYREIIGIARDSKYNSLVEPRLPFAYVSLRQNYSSLMTLHVRASRDVSALTSSIRNQVREIDPNLPILNVGTVSESLSRSLGNERTNAILLGIFGGLALLLSAIGLYGVISYTVSQRTHEIGIRMALGARQSSVVALVVKQGVTLALTGVGIGIVGAFVLMRLLSGLLFNVSATDPITFIVVPAILTGVALAACFVPARKAARTDPMIALRYE